MMTNGRKLRLLLLLLPLLVLSTRAQETPLRIVQKKGNLHFVNKGKGVDLAIKHNYFADLGGYFSTNSTQSFTYNGKELPRLGPDKFAILRTTFAGNLGKKWAYEFCLDYSGAKLSYLNMQLDYKFNDLWKLRVGNQRPPVTMSRNYSTTALMHYSTPMGLSLASSRRLGIAAHHSTARKTVAFGLFTKNINDAIKEGFYHRPDLLLAARSTYKVVDNQHTQLMLGANLEGNWFGSDAQTRTLKGGIESSINSARFIGLKLHDYKGQLNAGLEAALQHRQLLLTAEYLSSTFYPTEGNLIPTFHGFSVQGSYMIFGKPRGYRTSNGDFSGSPYQEGKTALETGIRFTGLSLHHGADGSDQALRGGEGYALSGFATYWLNYHLAFSLQATYLNNSTTALAMGKLVPGANFKGADFFATQLRVFLNF